MTKQQALKAGKLSAGERRVLAELCERKLLNSQESRRMRGLALRAALCGVAPVPQGDTEPVLNPYMLPGDESAPL